ncbi:MAG: hypothetical protein N2508_14705 [Anaerolineae bacterium]|nr:hypothetical protein [Anaerolineae bacterium]
MLLYRVTIENSGIAPATGVTFDDTPDPRTALLTGTLAICYSPLADSLTR